MINDVIAEDLLKNKIKLDFQNHINAIIDDSGTGKTYLMEKLSTIFYANKIGFIKINSDNDRDSVVALLNGKKTKDENAYILYDNADLTIDDEVYKLLVNAKATTIMSIKSYRVFKSGDFGFYWISYIKDGRIETEKFK